MFYRENKPKLNGLETRDPQFGGKSLLITLFVLGVIMAMSSVAIAQGMGTFYYPPGNTPPGPPPNYNQVDTAYFSGTPQIPLPPPDSGGIYIWVDSTGWNIANHIYSQGNSLEQFHGSVLAMLDAPPELGVNVFTDGFEIFDDTTSNKCYLQNDRWGWYQWSENLYEIWLDVSTREWKHGSGDPNDYMRINITGCAIDFNVWSSGHAGVFGLDQVYLGENMVTLDQIPGFTDTYAGIDDPYQSQAGSDPSGDPNITIFAEIVGTGYSYNKYGVISTGISYPCGTVLGEDYGDRFGQAFVYEGNGIQFSSLCQPDPCALNLPPTAVSPNDSTVFQCQLTEICLSGFSYSDPDNNVLSVDVIGGILASEIICFTPVEGLNSITLIVTDECGLADTAVTNITVELNEPPISDSPDDTIIFQCQLEEICLSGFTFNDPDDNIASVVMSNGTLTDNTVCFTPLEGMNSLSMIVTDECGVADTTVTNVTVNLNSPPVASGQDTVDIFTCGGESICIDGYTYSDPDNNILSVESIGGTFDNGSICFSPIPGSNTISLIVTDECGLADTVNTIVNVIFNSSPTVYSPNDTSMFVCDNLEICLDGFGYADSDDNIFDIQITGGTLNGNSVCFTPVSGDNIITLVVTDSCGETAQTSTTVNITFNTSPQATCPGDTSVSFVCQVSEICVGPFNNSDIDSNIDSAYVVTDGFSGNFDGTTFCFTPTMRAVYQIKYIVVDECGTADTCLVNVDANLTNESPFVSCKNDTTIIACDTQDICLTGFGYGDPDNNITDVQISGGTYDNGTICFAPVDGNNQIIINVTDECGLVAACTTNVSVSFNSPPSVICFDDTVMVVNDLSDICLPLTLSDPDNNIANVSVINGSLVGDNICFTPAFGINEITVIVTDDCGEIDSCQATVTVGRCDYTPGDVNRTGEINGIDITAMIGYFKGGITPVDSCDCRPEVPVYPLYAAGDVNGSCQFNGVDVTYMKSFFKQYVSEIYYCPTCPPTMGWITVTITGSGDDKTQLIESKSATGDRSYRE